MKTLVVLTLLLLPTALPAQDEPTEEEIKQRTADALKQCDADTDGNITLEEMQGRLEAFYVDFAKVGKDEVKQAAVRGQYPGLLTLQLFLAADLDDDHSVTEVDLKWLFSHPHDDVNSLKYTIWTLADADIDFLVEDFILCIRKGAQAHPFGGLRKTVGKGKNKAEKLADQAEPYRLHVVKHVLDERAASVIHTEYTDEQLSSLFGKLGRMWRWGDGEEEELFDAYSEVVTAKEAQNARGGHRAGHHETYRVGYKYKVSPRDKVYRVKAEITKTNIKVMAGAFDCDYFEIKCKDCSLKVWQHSLYPALPVKREWNMGGETTTAQLKSFEE